MITRRFAFLLTTLGVLTGAFATQLPGTIAYLRGREDWPQAVREVERLIERRHVKPPSAPELYRAALDGMLQRLDDPYAEFVPPEERAAFEKDLTGQFVGIGANIALIDGWPTILSPLPGSPALRAGLRPGDQVIAVDGVTTAGETIDQSVRRVVGTAGTRVVLTLRRIGAPPAEGEVKMAIVRAPVTAPVVGAARWDAARACPAYVVDPARRIAYVRVEQFTPSVVVELREALRAAQAQAGGPLGGLILDLRGNLGGLLDEAIELASLFVKDGTLITTRDRAGAVVETLSAAGAPVLPDVPLAILTDESSASSSEVVAGSMQERGRAVVIGTRTFGKGLIQGIEELRALPGAQVKMTQFRYALPSGRIIQREDDSTAWGVDPSPGFYVEMTPAQRNVARRRSAAWTALWPAGVTPAPGDPQPDWADPASISARADDPQLAAAVDAVQKRVDAGQWSPTGKPGGPEGERRLAQDERTRLTQYARRLQRELASVERRLDADAEGDPRAARTPRSDLWPDAADLVGGYVDVSDARGKRVARLRITGPDLEGWLLDADVEPEKAPSAGGAIK